MKRRPALVLALGLAALTGAPALAAECGAELKAPARQIVRSAAIELAFAPNRWPISVGEHFELNLQLCPKGSAALPTRLLVDAHMPLHRHGMNYRATVKALGNGRFVATGLMFHMPGRWQFVFDLGEGATAQRLTSDLDVQ
ncbi:MAG: hypothetical protein IAE92_10155 [Burkholderiaceae bacterium]|nr:hypothetical protein [Burkholderiaceae bacterium]